jgi:hypothetical protein
MSTDTSDIDPKILELIAEQADDKKIDEDLLIRVYNIEDEMVGMKRRHGIDNKLRRVLEDYVEVNGGAE